MNHEALAVSATTAPGARGARVDPVLVLTILLVALVALRIAALFLSKLELYPDEAQYWVWSRRLDFGYFSKPPMIAWLIRATTSIGGQSEPWVRLSAPVLHGLTALFLAMTGKRLYGALTGVLAAAFYSLTPGVDLSSAVIATDAPLMVWLSLSLWAYTIWWTAESPRQRVWAAAGFGAALGMAVLAKYAALYFVAGALAHVLVSKPARDRWTTSDALLAVVLFLVACSPNVAWNISHHFQTVAHTAADADIGEAKQKREWYDLRGGVGYIISQCGVFGPPAFLILCLGVVVEARKRALSSADLLLLMFMSPPFLVVLGEAIVARANANWAGAAYGPAAILCAAILVRWRAWRTTALALGCGVFMATVFWSVFVNPGLADRVSFSNSFKRARGWTASTVAIETALQGPGRPFTVVAVDDRFLFNALSYYGRDNQSRPAGRLGAPLTMWVRENRAHNQAEAEAPLTGANGGHVLMVSLVSSFQREIMADFRTVEPGLWPIAISLDPRRARRLTLFIGDHYSRRPRDPRTGRPFLP